MCLPCIDLHGVQLQGAVACQPREDAFRLLRATCSSVVKSACNTLSDRSTNVYKAPPSQQSVNTEARHVKQMR